MSWGRAIEGWFTTETATNKKTGDTSEFSEALPVSCFWSIGPLLERRKSASEVAVALNDLVWMALVKALVALLNR